MNTCHKQIIQIFKTKNQFVINNFMFNPYPDLPHKIRCYVLNSVIGQGAYSIVYKATNVIYNIDFAVKVVGKSKVCEHNTLAYEAEVNSLTKLDHPNVIRLYDFFNEDNHLFLVLEFCSGGALEDKIVNKEEISDENKIKICVQIISALKYCYDMSVAHQDIKTSNILFDKNGRIKIADFGLSGFIKHDENINEHRGTLSYSAPEVCQSTSFNPFKSDIWSLGVLFYRLFTYSYPFEGNTKEDLKRSIINGYYQEKLTGQIRKAVKMMLVVNPDERISIEDLSKMDLFRIKKQSSLLPNLRSRSKLVPGNSLNIKLSKKKSFLLYHQSFDELPSPLRHHSFHIKSHPTAFGNF